MHLRDYQLAAVESTELAFESFDKVLGVCPTGSGKTVIFSHLAKRRADKGERTLILAHRDELIDQACAKLSAATGLYAEREKADCYAGVHIGAGWQVVVASIQTMTRRLDRWPKDYFHLIVCDEAHHALSESWQRVLNHFDAQVLGVTATPHRGDKKQLGTYFQSIAFEVGLFDLIDAGWLSPIVPFSLPIQIDLSRALKPVIVKDEHGNDCEIRRDSGARFRNGDFDATDLGDALEPYLAEIAAAVKEHCAFRRTLAFLPLRSTSRKFVEHCQAVGLQARHIDGESVDRKELLQWFANGGEVLSNAMLLTEGFDDPGIDCVIPLRPTQSQPLYAQMVGRGTRIAPGKRDLLLLDFLWLHEKHRICRPAHLIAQNDDEAQVLTELVNKQGLINPETATQVPASVAAGFISPAMADLQTLYADCAEQREAALRKKLEEHKGRKSKLMSAEEFAFNHGKSDVCDYEPVMQWEQAAASPKQLEVLRKAKIDPATVTCRGHASQLIDIYFKNLKPRLAAPKAVALMRRMPGLCAQLGINVDGATAAQAGRFLKALSERRKQPEMTI